MQITSAADGRPLSLASASPRGPGPPHAAGPHLDTSTDGSSAPHFPSMPSLAADDATMPTASAAMILAASSSLDATVDTAAGATATATSKADVEMEVGTDPVPITTVPPTAGHISSFLSYIRRRVADDATATAASAAEALATPPSPDMNMDATEGATASAASADAVSSGPSDVGVFSPDTAVDGPGVAVGDVSDGTMMVHRSAGKRRGRRNSEARRTWKRARYDGSPSHGDHDTSASAS